MIFHEEFLLNYPVSEAWEFFTDFPGPIQVMPGTTEVRETGPLEYLGAAVVHIGPLQFLFRGEIKIVRIDQASRQVVLRGGASDHHLGGHFKATAYTQTLAVNPNCTRVKLEVHVGLDGLLGKLGMLVLRPKARSIVRHYGIMVGQELGQRRTQRSQALRVDAVSH